MDRSSLPRRRVPRASSEVSLGADWMVCLRPAPPVRLAENALEANKRLINQAGEGRNSHSDWPVGPDLSRRLAGWLDGLAGLMAGWRRAGCRASSSNNNEARDAFGDKPTQFRPTTCSAAGGSGE